MNQNPRRRCFTALKLTVIVVLLSLLWGGTFSANGAGTTVVGCTELLQNGGFEAGAAGWQEYSVQGYSLISDFNPRTGVLGAYLAGVNDADDRISQPVTLPAGASSITLRAWWYLATAETAGAFDTLAIWLLRPDNTPLTRLLRLDTTYPAGVWDEIVIDLSAYAGQTVVIQFVGQTDLSNISDFFLDDVSVSACSASASPTPTATVLTVTPTATLTPTATSTATATLTPTATATGPAATSTATATAAASPTATVTGATPATQTPTTTATVPPAATMTPTGTPDNGTIRSYLPLVVTG